VSLRRLSVVEAGGQGADRRARSSQTEDTMSSGILQDKIAIVFGAGGSIGAAAAMEFAAKEHSYFSRAELSRISKMRPNKLPPEADTQRWRR
jgi:hypothetical protein